jgi:hypothetical protein
VQQFFLLIVEFDSNLPYVMTSYTILDSPKVRIFFFSDSLLLEFLDKSRGFCLDGQIDHRLVELSTYKFWHSLQTIVSLVTSSNS